MATNSTLKNEIRFVDRLPSPRRTRKVSQEHIRVARTLMMNPAKWGIIRQTKSESAARGFASAVNQGDILAYSPKGDFKASVRKNQSGTYTVYVKYLGQKIL